MNESVVDGVVFKIVVLTIDGWDVLVDRVKRTVGTITAVATTMIVNVTITPIHRGVNLLHNGNR